MVHYKRFPKNKKKPINFNLDSLFHSSFSVLSLLFRITEKVSTPTSVVLMAGNSLVGVFWRELMTEHGAEEEAW